MNSGQAQRSEASELIAQGHAVIRMENDTMQALTIQRPRPSMKELTSSAIQELEAMPDFAKSNFYVIPYKEKKSDPNSKTVNVEGLSVKAAMVLARHFRNISIGGQIVGEDEDHYYIQGAALDLENNVRVQRPKAVKKIAFDGKSEYRLNDAKLDQRVQIELSKVIRNAVLALVPEPVKLAYWKRAKELAANGGKKMNKEALAKNVEATFKSYLTRYKVDADRILRYLEIEKKEEITEEMLGTLVGVWNSLNDGETTAEDAFPIVTQAGENATVSKLLDGVQDPKEEPTKTLTREQAKAQQQIPKAPMPGDPQPATPAEPPAGMNAQISDGLFGPAPEKKEPLFPGSPRELLLEDIRRALVCIWADFPKIDRADQMEYLSKMIRRSYRVDSWQEVQKLELLHLNAGIQQLESDINYVLDHLKRPHVSLTMRKEDPS